MYLDGDLMRHVSRIDAGGLGAGTQVVGQELALSAVVMFTYRVRAWSTLWPGRVRMWPGSSVSATLQTTT